MSAARRSTTCAHVGNARPVVVYDVVARLLRQLYPRVTYVRNITDVEDKINARAQETGEPIGAITARTTADFHADMAALGALPPDQEPRATAHIAEMIMIIQRLIASGHAYAAEGHVLFAVAIRSRATASCPAAARRSCWPAPGSRSRPTSATPAISCCGSRPADDLPGWDSPWGRGRPGWHIECSAMSWRYLGETFDIHGGGSDLIFPHHENEMAQSLCAFPGSRFARYWMHNGMLQVNGEKMSKSLGNFFTVRDVLAKAPGEAIRLLLLRTHYRSRAGFLRPGPGRGASANWTASTARWSRLPDAAAGDVPAAGAGGAVRRPQHAAGDLARCTGWPTRRMAGDRDAAAGLRAAGAVLGLLQQSTRTPGSAAARTTPPTSRPPSPNAWPPARRGTSPAPTRSAPTWRPRASCWRTARKARPGGART